MADMQCMCLQADSAALSTAQGEPVLSLRIQPFVRSEGSVRSAARTDCEQDEEEDDEVLCTDPIRWFGVLTPQVCASEKQARMSSAGKGSEAADV